MCGVAGFFHLDQHRPAERETLKKMTDVIAHRGPDGEGRFVENNLALGHRRLAIIDLNTGQQPMSSRDGRFVLTYNGEIYNYIELRDELKSSGTVFKTQSDSEVILEAYRKWGADCVEKFNGMWAFALWDRQEKRLFCSRDRAGEKPFFYTIHDNTFVFGSELKTLFAFGAPREINREMLDAYLCFTYVPAPNTFFKNIFKLKPGHSLIVENGAIKTHAYWDLPILPERQQRRDEAKILEEFEELFYDSVRLRMRSDVPFGAFLSGGLDSSAVVQAMSRFSDEPVKTCTMGTEFKAFDERDLAQAMAKSVGADHRERIVTPKDADGLMQKLALHYDEPFGDSSALPTYLVSKIARERVAVALTGDGGDEVLSGYTIHQGEKFSEQFGRMPRFFRKGVLQNGLTAAKNTAPSSFREKLLRAERVVASANLDVVDRIESKQTGLTREERCAVLGDAMKDVRAAREFIEEALAPVQNLGSFSKLNYWLTKISLPDDMLCKVDRASMAHGLETRLPFLDHRIMELLATVSMDVKMKGYTRKHILRATVGVKLPEQLLTAPKKGFALPLGEWFKNGASIETLALQAAKFDFIRKQGVEQLLAKQHSGGREAGNAIWTLGMLHEALK